MRQYGDQSRTAQCARALMLIGNVIFLILGSFIIAVGIYLIIEKIQLISWVLGTDILAVANYLIISAGGVMFLISFLGCFGTLFENRSIILLYCMLLSIIFLVSMMGAVLAGVYTRWVSNVVKIYMRESLMMTYGTEMDNSWNNLVTRSWDEAQEKWECCGVDDNGWNIYRKSRWFKDHYGKEEIDKPFVPQTCCKRDRNYMYINQFVCQYSSDGPPLLYDGVKNDYLFYQGCFSAGKKLLSQISIYLIVIGSVLSAIMIGGVICSLVLHSHT